MPLTCLFNFKNRDVSYMTGDNVEGSVYVSTRQLLDAHCIYVGFEGEARVRWLERDSHRINGFLYNFTVPYMGTYTYFNTRYDVHKGDLPIGTHKFDFCIPLPQPCDTSCTQQLGRNCYEVLLVIERKTGNNNVFTQEVSVTQVVDLNLRSKHLMRPLVEERNERLCFLPCIPEEVIWDVRIPYGGYVAGQDITYTVNIENQSKCKNLYGLEVILRQTYRFTSQTPKEFKRSIRHDVAEITHALPMPPSTRHVIEGSLTVPSVPPSTNSRSIIKVYYFLHFIIKAGNCSQNSRLFFPIEIGTIPLAQSVPESNKYFQYSTDLPRTFKQITTPPFEEAIMSERFIAKDEDEHSTSDYFVPKHPLFPNISAPNSNPDTPMTPLDEVSSASAPPRLSGTSTSAAARAAYNTDNAELAPLIHEPPKDIWNTNEPVASTSAAARNINISALPHSKFESPLLEKTTTGIKFINTGHQEHIRNDPLNAGSASAMASKSTATPEIYLIEEPEASTSAAGKYGDYTDDSESASTATYKTPLLENPSGPSPCLSEASISAATISADNNDESEPPLPKNEPPTLGKAAIDFKVTNIDRNDSINTSSDVPSISTDTFKTPLPEDPSGPSSFLLKTSTSAPTISIDIADDSEPQLSKKFLRLPTLKEATSFNVINIDRNEPKTTSSEMVSASTSSFKTPLLEVPSVPSPCVSEVSTSAATISADSESSLPKNDSSTLEEPSTGFVAININEMTSTSTDVFKTPLLEEPSGPSPFLPKASTSAAGETADNTDSSESASPKNG